MRKLFPDLLNQSVEGKVVLIRVDFNAPLADGKVTDVTRIKAALPTITALTNRGARVVLISHLNRPGGKVVASDRLTPVRESLEKLMGVSVKKTDDCVGPVVQSAIQELKNSEVLLLENLRFHKEEELNSDEFSKTLASYADYFVQDAFGAVHRAHASTVGIAKYLPSFSGQLLDKEIDYLNKVVNSPNRPVLAIIGGAKISSKLSVLVRLLDAVDAIVMGGAMVYTLLRAQGKAVGQSLIEPGLIDDASYFLSQVKDKEKRLVLPQDHVVVTDIKQPSTARIVTEFSDSDIGVDIGPKTIQSISNLISEMSTIFWNGPLGVFEIPEYANGTLAISKAVASASHATTIIGGGDSLSAVNQAGVSDKMDHLSTGGGASLEFLEGRELPGIAVLS
jgi:phosphoglycerate kinase